MQKREESRAGQLVWAGRQEGGEGRPCLYPCQGRSHGHTLFCPHTKPGKEKG